MKKSLFLILFLLAFSTLPAKNTLALTSTLIGNVEIELNPIYPRPNQSVRATVNTFATDLNRANITWLVNGAVVKQGVGEKSIGFTTGNAGQTTRVEVRVSSNDIGQISDSVSITPATVDLIWESDSYTPPFYKGKPLHSSQSNITLIALPQIFSGNTKVPIDQLIYEWKVNGNPLIEVSGAGKNAIKYKGPRIFGRDIVEVIVSTKSENIFASNNVSIATTDPEIYFYEDDSLYGIRYNKVLGRALGLFGEEYTLRIEPYYVTKSDYKNGDVDFQWFLNNQEVSAGEKENSITIRHTGSAGNSNLLLQISTLGRSLQEASRSISVYYGNTSQEI